MNRPRLACILQQRVCATCGASVVHWFPRVYAVWCAACSRHHVAA
jgi:hypothetical protein